MSLRLPGLVDVHVHVREPGATHKEDWDSASAAALAGGIVAILAMPNTDPAIVDPASLALSLDAARCRARCDYAQYLGATARNAHAAAGLAAHVAGLKMYLDPTFGDLRLEHIEAWMPHFEAWPHDRPLVVHAESRTLGTALLLCALFERPLHVCHVALRDEILLVRKARERGLPVTCEVAPHHLFLSSDDLARLGPGRCEVRPRLATPRDQAALWEHLDLIDCFATDHAPHLPSEKDGPEPPPGFPGLESALPLLLSAVHEGRLTLDDIRRRYCDNPRRIFGLPEPPETWIELDAEHRWHFEAARTFTRAGWSPFEGWPLVGRIERVVLRGREVVRDGLVLAEPGSGSALRTAA